MDVLKKFNKIGKIVKTEWRKVKELVKEKRYEATEVKRIPSKYSAGGKVRVWLKDGKKNFFVGLPPRFNDLTDEDIEKLNKEVKKGKLFFVFHGMKKMKKSKFNMPQVSFVGGKQMKKTSFKDVDDQANEDLDQDEEDDEENIEGDEEEDVEASAEMEESENEEEKE